MFEILFARLLCNLSEKAVSVGSNGQYPTVGKCQNLLECSSNVSQLDSLVEFTYEVSFSLVTWSAKLCNCHRPVLLWALAWWLAILKPRMLTHLKHSYAPQHSASTHSQMARLWSSDRWVNNHALILNRYHSLQGSRAFRPKICSQNSNMMLFPSISLTTIIFLSGLHLAYVLSNPVPDYAEAVPPIITPAPDLAHAALFRRDQSTCGYITGDPSRLPYFPPNYN